MSWKDELPDELKNVETLKDIEDVGSLAKQFVDQAKYLGNSIRLPGPDATPEAKQVFRKKLLEKNTGLVELPDDPEDEEAMAMVYAALGRPEAADKYDKPEVEGVEIDEARFKALAETAHKAGISKRQFKKLMGDVLSADAAMISAATEARNTELGKLKAEWGDAYDTKLKVTAKLAELTEAPKALVDAIKAGTADAGTLRWLDKLGQSIGGETSEIAKQAGGTDGALSKSEARERAAEIMQKLDDMPQSDPRYAELMNKRFAYMKIASA